MISLSGSLVLVENIQTFAETLLEQPTLVSVSKNLKSSAAQAAIRKLHRQLGLNPDTIMGLKFLPFTEVSLGAGNLKDLEGSWVSCILGLSFSALFDSAALQDASAKLVRITVLD